VAERRRLIAGLKQAEGVDPEAAKRFIYGDKAATEKGTKPADAPAAADSNAPKGPKPISRVPFTTRVREDFSTALKRASLERQLSGQVPNTLQDILEEMMEPWLRTNGYIK
jgi:hypothetical protein